MMAELTSRRGRRLACGCETTLAPETTALFDEMTDALLVVRGDGVILDAHPHDSALFATRVCTARALPELFRHSAAALLMDRVGVSLQTLQSSSIDIELRLVEEVSARARVRIVPGGNTVTLALHSAPNRPSARAERATRDDASFWALFEAAPIPLAVELTDSLSGIGSSRFNRKFTEVFGYDSWDVPTVQHWWPLAYPDESYRDKVRNEWFRRVHEAMNRNSEIDPMETVVRCKNGDERTISFGAASIGAWHVVTFVDLTDQKNAERALADRVAELEAALAELRVLKRLLPLCAWCKNLQDAKGVWRNLEEFLLESTNIVVSHTLCPACEAKHFRGHDDRET